LKNLCNIVFLVLMVPLVSLLLLTSSMASTHHWGASYIEFDGVNVILNNELTSGGELDFNIDMTEGGVTIKVVIMQGQGDIPDTVYVIPPEGYIALPETITVEETEKGTIMVVPEGMS